MCNKSYTFTHHLTEKEIMRIATDLLKSKVTNELKNMGESELSAKKLVETHFNNALYLKSARKIALYITA